jgi:hypothetical protein
MMLLVIKCFGGLVLWSIFPPGTHLHLNHLPETAHVLVVDPDFEGEV